MLNVFLGLLLGSSVVSVRIHLNDIQSARAKCFVTAGLRGMSRWNWVCVRAVSGISGDGSVTLRSMLGRLAQVYRGSQLRDMTVT